MKSSSFTYKILLALLIVFLAIYSIQFIFIKNSPKTYSLNQVSEIKQQTTNQIPYFWNLTQIQSVPLNISIVGTSYFWDSTYSKNFTIQELYYTSQIWLNNTPMRIHSELIFPDNHSGQLGRVAGVLAMHGLGGNLTQMIDLGYFLAAQNYTVLLIDFPGHGKSNGPPPSQEWIVPDLSGFDGNITADILNHTHFYLSARAAIRAIDVLLNQTVIDQDRIAVTGGSYGGLNTMFASNVYWQKVRSAIPQIAAGEFNVIISTPYSLFNLIVNPDDFDLTQPPLSDLFHYIDPITYVNTSHNPSTLFICGTNDDFFPLEAFNDTFRATHNTTKATAISPGGHHGFLLRPSEGTILYWLNYTLWNGPAPPSIQVSRAVESTLIGQKLKISANVSCDAPISKVILAYHREVMGVPWSTQEMTKDGQSIWTIEIPNLPFNADVTYYVMVEIGGTYYTMFSSYIWRDSLTTWLEIPFFILIGFALGLTIFLLLRRDINKIKPNITSSNRRKLSYLYATQISGIAITEIGMIICIYLPIVVILPLGSSLKLSLATFLNEFIDILPLASIVVFGILIAGFILSFNHPLLGGIINLAIPLSIIIVEIFAASLLSATFGGNQGITVVGSFMSIGIGVIIWIAMCIIQICFGIFKRTYKKRHLVVSSSP
jgi:fermentation-respiration switch protein FrsA (DUF1100 family)